MKNTNIEQIVKNHLEGILKRTRSTSDVYQVVAELIGDVSIFGLKDTTSKVSRFLVLHSEKTFLGKQRKVVYKNFLDFVSKQQSLIDFTMHFAGTLDSEETMWGKLNDGRMIYVHIARFDMAPKAERYLPEYWNDQVTLNPHTGRSEDGSVWVSKPYQPYEGAFADK